MLNYRLTRRKDFLRDIKSNGVVYLDDKVIPLKLLNNISRETIIDGGAFDGDTVEQFIKYVGGNDIGLEIHCYEADRNNCDKLTSKLEKYEPHKIYVHRAALWSEANIPVRFEGEALSGRVDVDDKKMENGVEIRTEKIDDYEYRNVGFIKLDIEGAEREALKGAEKIIRRYRPVLAICAYHLQDDLLVLAEYIQSLQCGYRLILRHYMCSSGDTILYALPEEYFD